MNLPNHIFFTGVPGSRWSGIAQTIKIIPGSNIIDRNSDQNIQAEQQLRVRKEVTLPIAQEYYYNHLLTSDFPVHFLDNEAFFLHKERYLRWVNKLLEIPLKFITEDPNRKYVKHVDDHWLDEQVWHGIQSKKLRGLE